MKEGHWYTFTIHKRIQLPDESSNFVLCSEEGIRLLLPCDTYRDYALAVGQTIECRIDKVNCSGKVFLEPRHPCYVENKVYPFDFKEKAEREDLLGIRVKGWLLLDCFGNEVFTRTDPAYDAFNPGKQVDCTVLRVKKASLFLHHAWSFTPLEKRQLGNYYLYRVLDEQRSIQQEAVWMLQNPMGEKSFLKKKHYTAYGIKPGLSLECRVLLWNPNGYWLIEPRHPYYKQGNVYRFKIQMIGRSVIDSKDDYLIVKDVFNNDVSIVINEEQRVQLKENQEIWLRVNEIRKGKPVLSIPFC